MEALRKLEQVHTVLSLLQSHNIASSSSSSISCNHDSDRFIANLVLFLIQPCGDLGIDEKCCLVSDLMNSKISAKFLEEAFILLGEEGSMPVDNNNSTCVVDGHQSLIKSTSPVHLINEMDSEILQTDVHDVAMIGLDDMQKANSTLEDFDLAIQKSSEIIIHLLCALNTLHEVLSFFMRCRSYFMFHDLDVNMPCSVFQHLPVLSFTEGYIYMLDNHNEKLLHMPTSFVIALTNGSTVVYKGGNSSCVRKSPPAFKTDPFKPLILALERYGVLTERMREEFKCGEEYWALERKLCSALMSNAEISVEDVMRAMHLKSFDYRILNLLLYQLRREKVNDFHMDFLSASEFLVEVADDLFDYEDDVLGNNFNILRMFVRLYGSSNASNMLAMSIAKAEYKYDKLLKTLDPQLATNYQKRCEEATKEGGKISGPALGTWNIPAVIPNEESYRLNASN